MSPGLLITFPRLLFLAVAAIMPLRAFAQRANQSAIAVVLDHDTFSDTTYEAMQSTANSVAEIVNRLIPGIPKGYNQAYVLCYLGKLGQPQTTLGPIPPAGFPLDRPINEVRIGVAVGQGDTQMLAFQLAHELTHVKMGAKNDNYLVELFAVAVQLEVLKRMGFSKMLAAEFQDPAVGWEHSWSPEVYTAILQRDDVFLSRYWQSQELRQQRLNHTDWNYSLSSVGALLIAAHGQLDWSKLLNIGELSSGCHPMGEGLLTQDCQPDRGALLLREPVLKWLGY